MTEEAEAIIFRNGRLYIARALKERFFRASETVILLRDEADLLVLPVRNSASGGYMLKIRNAAGDRVINGADFFRDHGVDDATIWQGTYGWCEKSGGLRLYALLPM